MAANYHIRFLFAIGFAVLPANLIDPYGINAPRFPPIQGTLELPQALTLAIQCVRSVAADVLHRSVSTDPLRVIHGVLRPSVLCCRNYSSWLDL